MSSERFDKLMKKQLESVRPDYHPSAWDRFQKRLPLVGFWPWLFRYGGWALSGLMLTGWIATLYSLRENQQVMDRLANEMGKKVKTTVTAPGTPLTVSTNRVDTVYIVKRTVVEHQHFYSPQRSLPAEGNQISQIDSSDSPVESLAGHSERLPEMAISRSRAVHGQLRPKVGSKQRIDPAASQSTTVVRSGKKAGSAIRASTTLPTEADSVQTLRTSNVLPDETLGMTNQVVPTALTNQQATQPDSVAAAAPKQVAVTPAASTVQNQPAQQRRPAFQFASLKPRVGIETMVTPHSIGVGPTVEFFPGENLGLSVGLLASQLRSENHHGLNDFNSATGKEFINQYQAFLPTQYDRIEDISIHTSVISLPISLKYYVPLRRRWSLLFQTGTSFDLSAYQQVLYESYYRGAEQHNSFDVKVKPQLFHNFMFGAGIQFHKSRISGQLIPYYLYDFRSIVNTPNGSNFGLKASIWLDLFK